MIIIPTKPFEKSVIAQVTDIARDEWGQLQQVISAQPGSRSKLRERLLDIADSAGISPSRALIAVISVNRSAALVVITSRD